MGAKPPVNHAALVYRREKMAQAHQYFSEQAREWLCEKGGDNEQARATAIERAARDLLQIVVIDLAADENAQEIFETLNARGAQLTAADLIKNFIFQRLLESDADVEDAYQKYWKDFETGFLGNRNQCRPPSLSAIIRVSKPLARRANRRGSCRP